MENERFNLAGQGECSKYTGGLSTLSTENLYFDGETIKTFIFLRKTSKNLYLI